MIFSSSECCDGDGVIMMIMSFMPINSVHYGRKVVFTGNGNRDSGFEDNLKLLLSLFFSNFPYSFNKSDEKSSKSSSLECLISRIHFYHTFSKKKTLKKHKFTKFVAIFSHNFCIVP